MEKNGQLFYHLACPTPPCDHSRYQTAKETGGSQAYFESKKTEQGEYCYEGIGKAVYR